MKQVLLIQGTAEWAAHRAQHFNASDAPVMLGCSAYKTRGQLVREAATGVEREHSDYVQDRVLNPGHAFEAKARALAEEIVGEDLYPCVGVHDDGRYSASFDGLTLMEDIAFEHKSLNDELRAAMSAGCTGADLPKVYRAQMEHQCLVSGAERVLFMASRWDGDRLIEERHCWYTPDPELRAEIIAAWDQFAADVANYQPGEPDVPVVIGRAPETLPALRVEVTGMVTASNLAEFKAQAFAVLNGINRDLQTDEDFANAEQTVKWCQGVEERLAATKDAVLGQTASIEAVFRAMDEISAETRRIRLELDKLVTREKEARKAEIVNAGVASVREHYVAINATLGEHALIIPPSLATQIGGAIRGKRSLTIMRDAVDTAAAAMKIEISQLAERVRANLAILAEHAEYASLFADRVQLCATKAPEDLRNLIAARIADHQRREAERLEREAQARQQQTFSMPSTAAKPCEPDAGETIPIRPDVNGRADGFPAVRGSISTSSQRIKLGEINARISPMTITAEGLASLGFQPVTTERAAKLYAAADFRLICDALANVITRAAQDVAA